MQVRALESFCIGGGVDVKAGEVFEIEPARALEWMQYGHVEPFVPPLPADSGRDEDPEPAEAGAGEEAPPEHPEQDPGALAGGDPRSQHREPEPARGRKPGVARRGGRGRKAG